MATKVISNWAIARYLVMNGVFAATMFGSAGTMVWMGPWVLLGISLFYMVFMAAVGTRRFPDIVRARAAKMRPEHWWDKTAVGVALAAQISGYVLAGLDRRFGWTTVPVWLSTVSAVFLFGGYLITLWVIATNQYAIGASRIQKDRGQRVVDSGPYGLVRHPMYSTVIVFGLTIPLVLQSLWVYIPSAIMIAAYAFRTVHEDRMLQNGLEGYRDYAARVRYRLVPRVW